MSRAQMWKIQICRRRTTSLQPHLNHVARLSAGVSTFHSDAFPSRATTTKSCPGLKCGRFKFAEGERPLSCSSESCRPPECGRFNLSFRCLSKSCHNDQIMSRAQMWKIQICRRAMTTLQPHPNHVAHLSAGDSTFHSDGFPTRAPRPNHVPGLNVECSNLQKANHQSPTSSESCRALECWISKLQPKPLVEVENHGAMCPVCRH
jgi:hypothetical protein